MALYYDIFIPYSVGTILFLYCQCKQIIYSHFNQNKMITVIELILLGGLFILLYAFIKTLLKK